MTLTLKQRVFSLLYSHLQIALILVTESGAREAIGKHRGSGDKKSSFLRQHRLEKIDGEKNTTTL
jgi:hypothetical protein